MTSEQERHASPMNASSSRTMSMLPKELILLGNAELDTSSTSSCRFGAEAQRSMNFKPKEITHGKVVHKMDCKHAQCLCGLRRMHSILAVLPRARRQQAIVRLPESVRRALIQYIELEEPLVARNASVSAHKMRSMPVPQVQACHIVGRSCVGRLNTRSVSRRRVAEDGGGICAVRTGSRTQYFARITIDGIAINSRCTLQRDEACMLRGLLVRVSARKPRKVSDAADIDWLLSAFTEVALSAYMEEPGATFHMDSMWSFRVLVDARKWTGRVISTQRVDSIGQALALRDRLEEACLRGWAALRVVLKDHLPRKRPGQSQGRGKNECMRTSHSRLIFLDNCYAATQKQRLLSWASATTMAAAKISRLSEHYNNRLERDLARLATTLARQVAGERKPKKRRPLQKGGRAFCREPLREITGRCNLKDTDNLRNTLGSHNFK